MDTLSIIGEQFRASLSTARTYRTRLKAHREKQEKVHVVGAGATLTTAYEQLRNAADNTEEHLLVQNAIRRHFRQRLLTRGKDVFSDAGDELIVELTLAGYLANDTVATEQIARINSLLADHGSLLEDLKSHGVTAEQATVWVLDAISVQIERELYDYTDDDAFIQFVYEHFRKTIDSSHVAKQDEKDYDVALFIAVHRALLKSDDAVIRADLFRRYRIDPKHPKKFVDLATHVDRVMASAAAERLYRAVYRRAAPERIVRRMLHEEIDVRKLLETKSHFMSAYELQVDREYSQVKARIRRAIIRSVIFLFITKVITGIAIEIPYDIAVHGHIVWLPLIINLLFPPVYMALLSLTLRLPGRANTRALADRIETVLYANGRSVPLYQRSKRSESGGKLFSAGYGLFGLALIGLISWGLVMIGFSLVHLVIFFIFLSTASFLGFRLSRMVRELEVVSSDQSSLTFVRDLLYLPFVAIGQWISDRYARINIVTLVLDMLIELPLKTVLRLVRQWAAFINAKKDEL